MSLHQRNDHNTSRAFRRFALPELPELPELLDQQMAGKMFAHPYLQGQWRLPFFLSQRVFTLYAAIRRSFVMIGILST